VSAAAKVKRKKTVGRDDPITNILLRYIRAVEGSCLPAYRAVTVVTSIR
jgi:hypothetical protein